jgi:6-phosphogluconolactonase
VDERFVPIDDPESNFGLIKSGLADVIPNENLYPFVVEKNEEISLKIYEDKIKSLEGIYDILVVSIGEDGHIGSLFPNHPSIKDTSDFYIIVKDSPKPPSCRMSMSARMIQRSKSCVIVVSGNQKKDALTKFLDGNFSYFDCPANLTLKIPELFVFTDINL